MATSIGDVLLKTVVVVCAIGVSFYTFVLLHPAVFVSLFSGFLISPLLVTGFVAFSFAVLLPLLSLSPLMLAVGGCYLGLCLMIIFGLALLTDPPAARRHKALTF